MLKEEQEVARQRENERIVNEEEQEVARQRENERIVNEEFSNDDQLSEIKEVDSSNEEEKQEAKEPRISKNN